MLSENILFHPDPLLTQSFVLPRSCSLQPEPEWHRPPDVPGGHDVTAGGRRGISGRGVRPAGR